LSNYELAAERAAKRHKLDPKVFKAMIRQESGFKENVGSSAGAQDIAQFMPGTAKAYGVTLGDNRVSDDLEGAARYLSENLKKYGTIQRALSVYNSGRPDAYKDPGFAGGQTYNYVRTILGGAKTEKLSGGATPRVRPPATHQPSTSTSGSESYQTTTPGVDNSGLRKQAALSYLQQGGVNNQAATMALVGQYSALKDVPGTTTTVQRTPAAVLPSTPGRATGHPAIDKTVDELKQQMNTIDDARVPYSWGGGHQKKLAANSPVTPLDCSGAVSRALGIDPRVASQFKAWGASGPGKRVTIYAKDSHVLMEVDGHFWGTSRTNPGGGAGWIKRSALSSAYLKGFVARHPPGA
jgi:hypothetical protein